MSVFGDFQKAFAQRFPGCELPQAWEEDVRANLTKHRQKVTALNEELEKEEFYVEYLEHLLADVERVKKNPRFNSIDSDTNPSLDVDVKKIDDADLDSKTSERNDCDEERSAHPLSSETETVCKNCSSELNDQNSYVTVISVGGNNPESEKADQEEFQSCHSGSWKSAHSEENNLESVTGKVSPVQKKKPPAPPKKPRKSIPVQAVPPVVQAPVLSTFDPKPDSNKPPNNLNYCEDANNSLVNTTDSGILSNGPSPTSTITSSIIYESKEVSDSFIDENRNEADSYTDENIYDTVAPDEGEMSNSRVSVDEDSKNEGDYVVFSESFNSFQEQPPPVTSRSRIAECLLNTQRSIEENPEYATYMNIDYFLKNQRKVVKKDDRSFSVGGDSDEDAFLACTSDHEMEPDHIADYSEKKGSGTSAPGDDVFDMDSGEFSYFLLFLLI